MKKVVGLALLVALAVAAPVMAQTGQRAAQPVAVSTETLYKHLSSSPLIPRPDAARKSTVRIRVTVSISGEVTSARAVSGPTTLRKWTADRVKEWTFEPISVRGAVRDVTGVVIVSYTWDGARDSVWIARPNGAPWNDERVVAEVRDPGDAPGAVDVPAGVPGGVPGGEGAPPPPPPDVAPPGPEPPKLIRVSGGVLAQKATHKEQPSYPPEAKAANVEGVVVVEVTIGESGYVISARAITGHPLLRDAAVEAARGWRFAPTLLSGAPVKVIGTITFNFRKD